MIINNLSVSQVAQLCATWENDMEKNVEQYLKRKIEKANGLCLKFTSPGFTGVPDRFCILPGTFFFVETKDTGKELRPRQKFVKKLLESFGLRVYKADSKKEVDEILSKEISNIRN